MLQCSYSCKFPASSIFSSPGWRWRYPIGAGSRFRWKLHPSSQAWPLLFTSNRGETAIAKCGNSSVIRGTVVPRRWTCLSSHAAVLHYTVETLYSTIYYSKYFIELNFDKSTQYVALWTHKRHPIPRPFGRAMACLLWVLQQKLTVL